MAEVTDAHGITGFSTATDTDPKGVKIAIKVTGWAISKVTKNSADTSTECQIWDSGLNVIDSANFSGDIATFSTPVAVTNGESYYIIVNAVNATITYKNIPGQYPLVGTNINFTAGFSGGSDDSNYLRDIASITTTDGSVAGINSFINIGDILRPISMELINIGDAWHPVASKYVNIGDTWRKVF